MPDTGEYALQWFPAVPPDSARAVALVAHGLNVDPARMACIIDCLTSNGIEALNVSLFGHGSNYVGRPVWSAQAARLESLRGVTYQLWREELRAAYEIAAQRAEKLGPVPLYLVGYSLGGLIGCDLFAAAPGVSFAKMVLFAPALQIRPLGYILGPLTRFPRIIIPSFSPAHYRSNRGTSMAAYAALYYAATNLRRNAGSKINVPTIIFLDPEDELVSFEGTQRFIDDAHLTNWRIYKVIKDPTAEQRYHHLVIDDSSVGQVQWAKIKAAMLRHLQAPDK